jgi:hypothetical protein
MNFVRRFAVIFLLGWSAASSAQLTDAERVAITIGHEFSVEDNITYFEANNYSSKLDVYRPERKSADAGGG